MGSRVQVVPPAPPRTQRFEPAFFRSDPYQPTVMIDVTAGPYMGRAAGTAPPPVRTGPRPGTWLLATMISMTGLAVIASFTYRWLVDTESGARALEAIEHIIHGALF